MPAGASGGMENDRGSIGVCFFPLSGSIAYESGWATIDQTILSGDKL